ncbi:hypothetical protein AZE42_12563, partial [Rhizopogon vesiculosus]
MRIHTSHPRLLRTHARRDLERRNMGRMGE